VAVESPGHVEVLAALLSEKEAVEAAVSLPEVLETGRHTWDDSIDLRLPRARRSRTNLAKHHLARIPRLLPAFANLLEERVFARVWRKSTDDATAEWSAVRAALMEFWRPSPKLNGEQNKRTYSSGLQVRERPPCFANADRFGIERGTHGPRLGV